MIILRANSEVVNSLASNLNPANGRLRRDKWKPK